MRVFVPLFLGLSFGVVPGVSFAALTTGQLQQGCAAAPNATSECTADEPCRSTDKTLTVYVPHNSQGCERSTEGCIATSRASLRGSCKDVMTVDCVRLGKCRYATCASDSSNYGKYFNLGTVTYRSALDMRMHSVPNVVCYVHDTGGAFRGRPDKLDLATTVCPTCTDAQAGRIAVNAAVALGEGAQDAATRYASLYNQPTAAGLTAGQNCIVSTEPLIVVPCDSIANRGAQPASAGVSPSASAGAPASAVSYPSATALPTSNTLVPSLAASEPQSSVEKQSKSVSDLLAALLAPTSSAGSLPVMPLTLTGVGSERATGLTPAKGGGETVSQTVSSAPQSTNTFAPSYRSPDLRWSAISFFQPFLKDVEAMVRDIIDLVRRL